MTARNLTWVVNEDSDRYEELRDNYTVHGGYFVCIAATPPWASHPGDFDCPDFPDVATAKAWVESMYILRECV